MGFKSAWLQERHNHLALLDTFFGALEPERSLCFLYAKRTPLAEDPRRVIVGVGHVAHVGQPIEYEYSKMGENYGKLRSMIWERSVQHSIRPGFTDGFLLPYHQILKLAEQNLDLDTSEFVAFAPEESWEEFSYGSEHVGRDTAIASLLACADALRVAQKVVEGDLDTPLRWIDARLNELWRMRGPCPGLGAALSAFGIEQGNFVAYDIAAEGGENEDPWPLVEQVFEDPKLLDKGLERRIAPTTVKKWNALPDERRALLKLISRFDLTADQATRFYQETEREGARIFVSDSEILANPYLLYELDRISPYPIALGTVDRGAFPSDAIRMEHPLPEPSGLNDDAVDPRRVRAFVLSVLCNHPQVKNGGVTLLAPTGKARVQLEQSTGINTRTIAQFLIKEDRYDPLTGRYRLSKQAPVQAGRTVVVDEASMLTEEQLAAVLDAVTGVERLILVGDPRQLPPIGSGRPFVDIVARLEPEGAEGLFPGSPTGSEEATSTVKVIAG